MNYCVSLNYSVIFTVIYKCGYITSVLYYTPATRGHCRKFSNRSVGDQEQLIASIGY